MLRERKKGRGIPKITLIKVVKNDMLTKEVTKKMTSNIIERKKRIHLNILIKEVIEWCGHEIQAPNYAHI